MSTVAGLLLPVIAAWGVLRATRLSPAGEWPLKTLALAFGIGIGLSSITTLILVTHGIALTRTSVVLDAMLWTSVGAVAWWLAWRQQGVRTSVGERDSLTRLDWIARAAFVAVAVLVVAAQVAEYSRSPHGQWDAWAIWNQKARFLARGGTEDWKGMLSIPWANPGHPMLVSASVARLWAYAGSEPTLVPAVLAVLFALAIAIIVIAALDPKRPVAWLAGAVVIAPTTFVHQVAAQTADLPLAFFVVVTLVQLRDYLQTAKSPAPARALVIAGLFAGLAAWTKNEGLVLAAGTSLVLAWAIIRLRRITDVAWWGAGLSAPVAAVLWYKVVVAPVAPEYMPATETAGSITQRLLDPDRIQSIVSVGFDFLVRWGGTFAAGVLPVVVIAAVAAAVPQRGGPFRYVLTALAIMVASYAALWLSAPFDASWLVITTFDRLMVQIWPTLVVAAFSLTVPARA